MHILTELLVPLVVASHSPAPPGGPVITSIDPPQVPALSPTNEQINTIHGSGFTQVVDVIIGGRSLGNAFPPAYTVVDSQTITFAMPILPITESARVEVHVFGAPNAYSSVEIVANETPVVRLGAGFEDETFVSFFPFQARFGGTPGHVHFLWLSLFEGPTSFPGLFDLDIGDGMDTEVLNFGVYVIPPAGFNHQVFDSTPVAAGKEIFFQTTEYDPVTATLPMPASNVRSALFIL